MLRHGLTLPLALYLLLDLSSPFIPGAFAFDPDESVQVTERVDRRGTALDSAILVRREPTERRDEYAPLRGTAVAAAPPVTVSDLIVSLRETRFGSHEPPSPAEDD